jgi:protein-tyrosine-phosphatase
MTTHVLILCTHNSARSVLGEAMLNQLAARFGKGVRAHSAGSAPPLSIRHRHHRRVERLVARAATFVARVERSEIQRIDRVVDEVGQVACQQPVLRRRRQQHHLVRFAGAMASSHAPSAHVPCQAASGTTRFCRADS